jgi:hypothetical protein
LQLTRRLYQNSNRVEEGESRLFSEPFPLKIGYNNIKIIGSQFLGNRELAKIQAVSPGLATINATALPDILDQQEHAEHSLLRARFANLN